MTTLMQHLTAKERNVIVLSTDQTKQVANMNIPEGHVIETFLFADEAGNLCVSVKTRPSRANNAPAAAEAAVRT